MKPVRDARTAEDYYGTDEEQGVAPETESFRPPQPQGVNVQPVRDAIEALRQGTGSFDALKTAVQGAQFAIRPSASSLDELADRWDYVPVPDSFTDTVSAAQWQRVLTRDQVKELQGLARFVAPDRQVTTQEG